LSFVGRPVAHHLSSFSTFAIIIIFSFGILVFILISSFFQAICFRLVLGHCCDRSNFVSFQVVPLTFLFLIAQISIFHLWSLTSFVNINHFCSPQYIWFVFIMFLSASLELA